MGWNEFGRLWHKGVGLRSPGAVHALSFRSPVDFEENRKNVEVNWLPGTGMTEHEQLRRSDALRSCATELYTVERASQKQSSDTHKTPYDPVKRCRERKINIKAPECVNRLNCLPPTKANRVQFPSGSLQIFTSGNRAKRCRWSTGFLGDLPFPPPLHSDAAPYPLRSALIASQDLTLPTCRTTDAMCHAAPCYTYLDEEAGQSLELSPVSNGPPKNRSHEVYTRPQLFVELRGR
ncbi:hypothetical protein PR048_002922 [Dryococelus australis]|uniref:Uncharacterized protein n=1 Tax=Dryococelus australis TaxID=614101 RepID=A0ABQ9ILI8_9NEOP|nr:hypothetical protein PR048_002922 [Dryococelus australis]